MYSYKRIALCCFILSFVFLPGLASAASIAKVIAVSGGVSLERAGQSHDLKLKDDLLVNDVIRTDSTGKAQFIFNDNSTVTVGVNTSFVMEEYNDTDIKSFKSNVALGLARFVTGSIVETNPEAFSVKTPEATVGIRGTTLAVITKGGQTSVSTENSTKLQSVVVNNTVVPPGYMAVFGPNASIITAPTPMTPAQRQNIIDQTRIGVPVAVASKLSADVNDDTVMHGLANQDSLENTLNGTRLLDTASTSFDEINESIRSSLASTREVLAVAQGTFELNGVGGNDTEGNFSFEANLTNGVIHQAAFVTTDHSGGTFSVTGGTGSITQGSFNISGGQASFITPTGANIFQGWNVNGTEELAIGNEVEGDLTVSTTSPQTPTLNGGIEGDLRPRR